MSYVLRGVLGCRETLQDEFAAAQIVDLPQGFGLVPIDIGDQVEHLGRFHSLTEAFERRLGAASSMGLIAYVEADFFGGTGTQSAVVWHHERIVLGPLHTQNQDGEDDGYETTKDMAINRALQALGVVPKDSDAFDALGLGRHRETAMWVQETLGHRAEA